MAGFGEPEAEVRDAARLSDAAHGPLEHQYVACARRLRLDEVVVAVDRDGAEDGFIESERSLRIAHRQREMREPVA